MPINETSGAPSAVETRLSDIVDTVPREAPEPQEQAPEPVAEETSEEAPAEGEKVKKPAKGGFTKKLERQEAELAALREQLAKVQAPPVKTPEAAGKPKIEDYADKTYEQYYEDLAEWKLDQKLKDRDSKSQEQVLRKERDEQVKAYKARADAFKETVADFDEVIEEYDKLGIPVTPQMSQALLDSDMGPELVYYVAQNPEEGERLAGLGPIALAKAVGKLEAKLEAAKSDKPEVKVSKAPPPISPIGKSSASVGKDPYKGEMSHEEYKAWRARQ